MIDLTDEELKIISFLVEREINECEEGWQLGSIKEVIAMKSALLKIKGEHLA